MVKKCQAESESNTQLYDKQFVYIYLILNYGGGGLQNHG